MSIGNTGISPSYKVPRYIAKILLAAGAVSASSQRLRCLLVGKKLAAGSATPDASPFRVTDVDYVDATTGVGSQIAMMAYLALTVPSIELWLAPITEPAGGTQATATIVISGTWTTPGLLRFRIAGIDVSVGVASTDAIDVVGANIAVAMNGKTRTPVTTAYNAAADTITITSRQKGVEEKDWILYYDAIDAPAGIILTITGSGSVNTNGVRLGATSTGTGAVDVTTLLTKLTKTRYARIALGHNDSTNTALWETQVNTLAGPLQLLLDQFIIGANNSLASTITIAQTNLNAFRAQAVWLRNSENHPAQVAAMIAALRSVAEQDNPITDWDGYLLDQLRPQAFEDDIPTDAEQDQGLNAGVTPLTTVDGGVRVVRMITSYCVSGGVQDERCLDIGDVVMTDYATLDIKLMYETEFRPANPIVRPNPAPEEEPPTAGVGYPLLWNSKVAARLQLYYTNGWLSERPVGKWAPISDFDVAKKCIVTDTPLAVQRLQHRLDNVMRQIAT